MNQRNHLNSVLIEGEIVKEAEYSENLRQCVFHIESNYFAVQITEKMAKACTAKNKGLGVRVVGRIKSTQKDGEAIIIAEQIEFRPEIQPGKNKEGENVE